MVPVVLAAPDPILAQVRDRHLLTSNAQKPGAFSRLLLHTPFVGWIGNGGGVNNRGPAEKSKSSIMLSAFASRSVSGATLNVSSISLRIDV